MPPILALTLLSVHPASSRIFHQSDRRSLGSLLAAPCPEPFESAFCTTSFIFKDPSISCDDFVIRFVKTIRDRGPLVVFASESSFDSHHPRSKKTLPLWSSWSRRNLPIPSQILQSASAGHCRTLIRHACFFYCTLDTPASMTLIHYCMQPSHGLSPICR